MTLYCLEADQPRWGMPMYDWHVQHSDKGRRFAEAMRSVSKGECIVTDWLQIEPSSKVGWQGLTQVMV